MSPAARLGFRLPISGWETTSFNSLGASNLASAFAQAYCCALDHVSTATVRERERERRGGMSSSISIKGWRRAGRQESEVSLVSHSYYSLPAFNILFDPFFPVLLALGMYIVCNTGEKGLGSCCSNQDSNIDSLAGRLRRCTLFFCFCFFRARLIAKF